MASWLRHGLSLLLPTLLRVSLLPGPTGSRPILETTSLTRAPPGTLDEDRESPPTED